MDAFEQIVKVGLEEEGWWVRQGYKVRLDKTEKVAIGRQSSPRWELDLVAFQPKTDVILVVECKSYLDSYGVREAEFVDSNVPTKGRYKLFTEERLRQVVLDRLKQQLIGEQLALHSSTVQLALAVGKFKSDSDRKKLHEKFEARGWRLIDDLELREWILRLSNRGYEDDIATIVVKLVGAKKITTIAKPKGRVSNEEGDNSQN